MEVFSVYALASLLFFACIIFFVLSTPWPMRKKEEEMSLGYNVPKTTTLQCNTST